MFSLFFVAIIICHPIFSIYGNMIHTLFLFLFFKKKVLILCVLAILIFLLSWMDFHLNGPKKYLNHFKKLFCNFKWVPFFPTFANHVACAGFFFVYNFNYHLFFLLKYMMIHWIWKNDRLNVELDLVTNICFFPNCSA